MARIELNAHALGDDPANHILAAQPDHTRNRNRRKEIDHGVINRIRQDRVLERVHVAAVDLRKAFVCLALAVEKLQHHHAAHMFLQICVDTRDGNANPAIGIPHLVPENLCREHNERQHGEGDQRQFPVHAQHDGQNAGQYEQVFKNRDHAGGEHFVQRVHIGSDARDQPSYGILVIKTDMHPLQMTEDLAAQVEHDLLPGPLHEVGLQEFEHEGEDQQPEIDPRDLRDSLQRPRIQPVPQPRHGARTRRQIAVHRNLHQVGPEYVGKRLQNDGGNSDPDLPPIRAQVGQQPSHQTAVIRFT